MMEVLMFYIFGAIALLAALGVLLHPNPVISALHLVAVMVGVSGLFFNLNAPFIGMVQLLVYAGAVIILFLFVVMIFDTKNEKENIFTYGKVANGLKVLFAGMFSGLLLSSLLFKLDNSAYQPTNKAAPQFAVENISKFLYTDYMFTFEILGLLLLVIPIGVVALSRIRGGTHAD